MQNTKEIEQKLVETTLHTQSLSPESESIVFSKKIRLFTSSMSLPPIYSFPTSISLTSDCIMST